MEPIDIKWDEYFELIKQCIDKLEVCPDYIFAPTRGGLIPAVITSHSLGIRMYPMEPHNLEETIQPIKLKEARTVLFIDDIYDSGQTANKCVKYLEDKGYTVITCAIILKRGCKFKPSIYGRIIHKDAYVIFPYENNAKEIKEMKKRS